MFRWKVYGLDRYTGEYPGKVLEQDRPGRYSFEWEADSRGYFTTVKIDFRTVEDGALLQLLEYGFEDTPDGMRC